MADPFVAEVRIFPCNFAPKGWAFCDGQLLAISQNTALFSLLGTTYGGNGQSNFALPNLQGRSPLQPGQGPGLSLYDLGEQGGSENVTLINTEMPAHTHNARASTTDGSLPAPGSNAWAIPGADRDLFIYNAGANNQVNMAPDALNISGNNQPHNNLMPYLTLTYCIALQGIFPQRP
jgi:microcystin-dependent protein